MADRIPTLDDLTTGGIPSLDDLTSGGQGNFDFGAARTMRRDATRTIEARVAPDAEEDRRQRRQQEATRKRQSAPIATDNEAERVGVKFWQRIRGIGAGGGRLAGAALEELGFDPNGDAATWLRQKSQSGEEYASRPVQGETTWEALKKTPTIGGLARFVLEQGGSSVADMGVLASGAGIAPYVALQAGSTGQQRAQNNGEADAQAEDIFKALPSAVASAALEKVGMHGIFGAGAKSVVGRIAQAFGTEALTEALQSPIEYAGSNLGTDKGFDPMEALDQAAAGAVAGGFMGGSIRAGIETPGAVARRFQREQAGAPADPTPGVIEQAAAIPAPVTPEDAASPLPTDLIAEGKAITGASTAQSTADSILTQNGAPSVGSRVSVTIGGKTRTGTISDAFVDESDAELGAQPGVNIALDGGGTMREYFADLKDAGVTLAQVEQAQRDMEAGGLTPSATLEAIAQTGETPAGDGVPSLDEIAAARPLESQPTPRPARGAFDVGAYMARARQAESGGNDGASNARSSASGRYQFTDGTFNALYQKVFGAAAPAGAKNDPAVQERLMQRFTADNAAGLRKAGVEVTDATAYAAHHFGLGGALDMVRNPTAAVDPAVVKANPQFRGMTNAEALAWTARHIGAQGGQASADTTIAPVELDENDRPRQSDQPLTTAQVELPAARADEPYTGEAEREEAAFEQQQRDRADMEVPPASTYTTEAVVPPAPAASAATITATPSGKGIALAGASEAELAAVAQAVPKARSTPNKDGALVFSAKYRGEIEAALSSVTLASTAPAEQAPSPVPAPAVDAADPQLDWDSREREDRAGLLRAAGQRAEMAQKMAGASFNELAPDLQRGVTAAMRAPEAAATPAPRRELTPDEQRASIRVSDALPGGTSIDEAAATAQRRAAQGDPIAAGNTRLPEGYTFAKDSGGALFLQGPDRQMVGSGPLASPGLSGERLKNAIDKGVSMAEMRASRVADTPTTTEPVTPAARPIIDRSVAIVMDPAAGTVRTVPARGGAVMGAAQAIEAIANKLDPNGASPSSTPSARGGSLVTERQAAPGERLLDAGTANTNLRGDGAAGRPVDIEAVSGVDIPGDRAAGTSTSNSAPGEGGLDIGGVRSTDFGRSLFKGMPRLVEGFRSLDVPRQQVVQSLVADGIRDREVFDAVVSRLSVPVVNDFLGREASAKISFDDAPVLADALSGDLGPYILSRVFPRADAAPAPTGAEVTGGAGVASAREGASAPVADDRREQAASSNRIFTDEAADKARAILKAKLNGTQLNSGIDPEVLQAGIVLAGYHIEKSARKFADYSRAMVADLGENIRPYLRTFYEAARYYPGMEAIAREMSTPAEIEEASRGDQGAVSDRDAGPSAADVQRAAPDRGDGRAPEGEGGRGGGDVQAAGRGRADASERAAEGRAAPAGDRGTGPVNADRVPADPARAGRGRRDDSAARDAQLVTGENWRIEPGSLDESRGAAQKARDNVAAIEIVKQLDLTGKPATREQQAALAKYVGWGGLKGAFNETNGAFPKGFEKIGPQVRELLTAEEYETARRSIQYAHYTSEKIIRPMWDAAVAMGFTGGKVFEPGMGTGNFVGMMPADVAARTQYQGVEFDGITARIAQLLYPQSGIRHGDFTQGTLAPDSYDLVIGNPPFSQTVVKSDPQFGKLGFVLHDFFFAKSLNAVRPGGLLMFVTSAGTMNKVNTDARAWLAERADLVGAVRLPGGAFRENAGTDVTTDIVVLRKRLPGEAPGDRAWVETGEIELPSRSGGTVPAEVNRYFLANPDQVLGEQGMFDTLTAGERYGVRLREGADMAADLSRALGAVAQSGKMAQWDGAAAATQFDAESKERKEGSFYVADDGRLMQQRGGLGAPVEGRGKGVKGGLTTAEQDRVRALVPIRDALRTVLGHDMAGRGEQAEAARAALNGAYDRFVQQFGPINKADIRFQRPSVIEQESARAQAREEVRLAGGFFNEGSFAPADPNAKLAEIAAARRAAREAAEAMGREWDEGDFDPADMPDKVIVKRPNVDAFMDDQEGYRLRSIEHYNDDTGEAQKGAVFFRNVVSQDREPEIKSSGDALLYVLNRTGRPDIDEIASRAGLSRGQVLEELGEKVFRLPGQGETYQTREQYLSGNVRDKLAAAQAAAERDPDFRRNVAALEAVQPQPLGPSDISAGLGMPWIPQEVVAEFAETLGLRGTTVRYFPKLAQWNVTGDRSGAAARSEWGTSRRDAVGLLADALNRQTPVVFDTFRDADGKEQRVRNDVETQAAQDKIRAILDRFREWVWSDQKRADALVALYNRDYNNLVAPVYDGSYLTTPGIAEGWSWRPHQRRVVSRIIQSGNTYMAHAVGAGKTSAMIGAGMEMRRLGLVRKPMYSVPNHMLGQFTKEFYEQYPTAKIMVADEKQFHTDRRKQFIANVGTSDLDAVIITHSAFSFIPISDEFNESLLREQIDEFRAILSELKAERSGNDQAQRITQRNIEQQIEAMEQKIKGRKKRSDQVFTFEETGIDFLFVDEAHLFRKLDFATKMSNVRGVDPNGSGMSYDLFAKTRYLEQQNPGRSHVLASGTPVTNTMAELFSVQRYLQPQELAARALGQFDAWAGAFGETVTQLEQDPAGGYKPVTRFAKFVNVPELSNMVRQVMDVVTSRELEQYVVRPKLKGGKRQMIVAQPTPQLTAYQQTLQSRMTAIEQRRGKPKKGDDILLSVIGDGRKAAIDMRLVNPAIREEDKSKLELMIDNVSRIAKESANQPFHRAEATGYSAEPVMRGRATQMIFSDLGINGEFPIHRYIKQQLVARGLKENEVAIISDYKTSVARQRLFNDMNEGKVRVLIGSVPKMGTGVNAQRRLLAIHNLDPQWYPANDEQRNGRGLRQGNMNPELGIYDYSTKATYDSTMWNMMETKARFIEGFFNGDPTLRSMDDLGEASQYEQAKALTTADPRIMQLTQDKQDLERAMLRRAAFERDLFNTRERIRSAEDRIERSERAIPLREKDIADRQDIAGDAFTAKVGPETFDDREAFGEAVLARMNELAGGGLTVRDRAVGEIGGFRLTADVSVYGKNTDVALYLNRNGGVQERIKTQTPAGIAQSAAAILRGFEGDVENAREAITNSRREIEEFTPQTEKTFTGAAEITDLERRVSEMEATLTAEAAQRAASRTAGATAAPADAKLSIADDAATGEPATDLDGLRAQLVAEAARMGMPGDRLTVEVVNKLLNDDRVAGMYLRGIISVAADASADPRRTLDHEFVHALRDMGLFRPAEWNTLARAARADTRLMAQAQQLYPELDQDGLTEEAIARMFEGWKGDRRGFAGAALGRIADFIAAVRRLVSKVDTAGDVMRRINSGEIGARDTTEESQADEARFSIIGSPAANPNPTTVSEAMERARTLVGRMAEGYEDWRVALQDRMLPVLRAEIAAERVIGRELTDEERPYLAEELMAGRTGAKIEQLADNHIDPLWAAMEAEKISTDELESYLYAKHAPERNAHIFSVNPEFGEGEGSGMTDIEAAAILARIDRDGRTKEFERVADRVYAILQFARDERADAGLLSTEQVDSWNSAYQFYVPLRGFAELDGADENVRPNQGGSGLTVRGAESKRAFGRRSRADDILAHTIMQAEEAIMRGEKNRVARAFYDLAQAAPDEDFWETNKVTMERRMNPLTGLVESYPVRAMLQRDADMTVSLKIDGKERRVTMNKRNPQARKLAEAMRRLDEQKTAGALIMLSKMNRWLSSVNTSLNPEFIITNAFRDIQTAMVNLGGVNVPGIQRGTLKDWRAAMAGATRGAFGNETGEWGRWWREFTDEGGRVSYNQMQDLETLNRDMARRFDPKRRPNPDGLNTSPKQLALIALSDIKAAYGFIDKLNTGVENGVRLAAYKNAREAGLSAPRAASLAKNISVNFNRRGTKGVQANALYLFYNASIQGSTRILMALKSPRVQKIVAGIVVAGAAQELLNMMLSGDDDDGEKLYDKIPEFEKERNMILMAKGPWGEYLKLPMPYGYSAFHTLGRGMVRLGRGQKFGEVASDTLMSFVDSFNPIGSGSLLNAVAPTFVDPIVDLKQNRDFADRPIMPDDPQYGPSLPDNQRFWGNVNPVWKEVAQTINGATGGDKVVAGAVDISPETLEYLFGVATGAAGAFVDRTAGAVVKAADGDDTTELSINDVPLARKVVGKKPGWYDKAALYARLSEVDQAVDNAKRYGVSGGGDAARAYVAKERPLISLMDAAKFTRKQMSEVRQAKAQLQVARDRGRIDKTAYAERMKKVSDAESRIVTSFNKVYVSKIGQPLRL